MREPAEAPLRQQGFATYHLVSEHQHSLETELALAVVKEVLETRAEQVDNHDVVVALHSKPVDVGDTHYAQKQ